MSVKSYFLEAYSIMLAQEVASDQALERYENAIPGQRSDEWTKKEEEFKKYQTVLHNFHDVARGFAESLMKDAGKTTKTA